MSKFFQSSGSTRYTSDSAVGVSGKPIRVFFVEMLNGASAGQLVLRNGTSASATVYVTRNGSAASVTDGYDFGDKGLLFPDGCFHDKDTNTTAIVVEYRVEG